MHAISYMLRKVCSMKFLLFHVILFLFLFLACHFFREIFKMKTKTFIRYVGPEGGAYPKELENVLEHSMLCTEHDWEMNGKILVHLDDL